MTKDEALKMAIAEIEGWIDHAYGHTPEECADNKAIQACKEALEQPLTRDWKETVDERIAKDDEFKQALAQPAQEPVAWMDINGHVVSNKYKEKGNQFSVQDEPFSTYSIPLYTHPTPSWQELSDVELSLLAEEYTGADGLDVVDYGRAVMQALKEKNYGQ